MSSTETAIAYEVRTIDDRTVSRSLDYADALSDAELYGQYGDVEIVEVRLVPGQGWTAV